MRSLFAPAVIPLIITLSLWLSGCDRLKSIVQGSGRPQSPPQTFSDAQAAATQSLATFRQLVNAQNYKDLGFETPDEVAHAALGQPIKILVVPLNQLLRYERGSDPTKLLTDFNQVHYPVLVNEQVRSAILVDQTGGKWKAGTFGASKLAKLIGAARTPNQNSTQDSVVQIPALGLYFLAHTAENRMTLTALSDSADFGFKAGGVMPADEVFAALVLAAKRLKADAPM